MTQTSFTDNIMEMAAWYQDRSAGQSQTSGGGDRFSYEISVNRSLTALYGFPCYAVKFSCRNARTVHIPDQEEELQGLFSRLFEEMDRTGGYYNLRIPAHFVDLLRALNSRRERLLFCGGTMYEISTGGWTEASSGEKPGIRLLYPDREYLAVHRQQLLKIAYTSFADYSSQYHISPVTAPRAGKIYENWMDQYFSPESAGTVMAAELEGEPVGYQLLEENERFVEGVLVSVAPEARGRGIYRAIIAEGIRYARSRNKTFVTSTQLDNYVTQGTWGNLGLRQLYAIYNFHYDVRRSGQERKIPGPGPEAHSIRIKST